MEGIVGSSVAKSDGGEVKSEKDQARVKMKTLRAVLEQCQRALESLSEEASEEDDEEDRGEGSSGLVDKEADELCDLFRSRVECPDFLEKLETAQMSVSQHFVDEGSSWDMVSKNDLWDDDVDNLDDEYVLVGQEDIVEGIACFMAAYLLSVKQAKNITPNQLQDALSKTFAMKKKKGKLRKAWDGGKVIYNVVSWGATAIGVYQNPVILRAAAAAFWASCHVMSFRSSSNLALWCTNDMLDSKVSVYIDIIHSLKLDRKFGKYTMGFIGVPLSSPFHLQTSPQTFVRSLWCSLQTLPAQFDLKTVLGNLSWRD